MEHKHFSHSHDLTFYQIEHNSETICSGCKLPCSNTAYAYFECKFFLHEQCFNAAHSLDHPTHLNHPLNLVPYPTYPPGQFICDSCTQPGFGFSYSCSKCNFDLHLHCSNINFHPSSSSNTVPSDSPKEIKHKSHPEHILKHFSSTSYDGGKFSCNACVEDSEASGYNCSICRYDLHEKCASLAETVMQNDHEHQLILHYSVELSDPSHFFTCDVCYCNISKDSWVYYCKPCDFGTHVNCVMAKAKSKEEVAFQQNLAAQQELMKLQNQLRFNAQCADIMSHYWRRCYFY